MSTALERLQFIIGLTDNVTRPLHGITNSMTTETNRWQSGWARAAVGIGAVVGLGYSLKSVIDPTRDIMNALGDVRSMGVAETVLKGLSNTALEFSMQYGESAADFVRASYDIQGAISTLQGNELSTFTKASAILAKGTKADVAEITDYVGLMYNVFQTTAEKMGKNNWINQMVGQSAEAINVFKSDGHKMAEAFKGLNKAAGLAPLNEQLAILGTLQNVMEGGEASTKYKAFLLGATKAQKELKLSFVDNHGYLLGAVPILEKITAKYGDLNKAETGALINKAFGSDEALLFIKQFAGLTNELAANIEHIGKIDNMDNATKMSQARIDQWSRMSRGVEALEISLGNKLMPQIMPMIDGVNHGIAVWMRWGDMFPHLSGLIDKLILPIIALTLVTAVMWATMGRTPLALVGWAFRALFLSISPIAPIMSALRWGYRLTMIELSAGTGIFSAVRIGLIGMTTQLWLNVSAIWAWTTALLANPMTWVVIGVLALAGALIYAAFHFDSLGDAATTAMAYIVGAVIVGWRWAVSATADFISDVKTTFTELWTWFTTFDLWSWLTTGFNQQIDNIKIGIDDLMNLFNSLVSYFSNLHPFDALSHSWNDIMNKANSIYGLNAPSPNTSPLPLPNSSTNNERGGLLNKASSIMYQQGNAQTNNRTIGSINIYNTKNDLTNSSLAEHLKMAGG